MAVLSKNTMFDPVLVSDLITKVQGKSSLAALSAQVPIPFNGMKQFTFNMDNEIDIVAENGKKSAGGLTVQPVTVIPVKFEYGARISDEYWMASEEEKLDILQAFNDGFAKKVARGLDLAAFHGVNPRTGNASAVIGTNHFDSKVTTTVTYAAAKADENLESAITAVQGANGEVTGLALATSFASALGQIKENGVTQYPEFRFGGRPSDFHGLSCDVNNTIYDMSGEKDYAIVGAFLNGFKWGFAKEIPVEIIPYGDPDNTGLDLKGSNQIYIRAEVYLGWGILLPSSFARIVAAASTPSGGG